MMLPDGAWAAIAAVVIAVIGPGGVWVVLMQQRRTLGRVETHTANVGNGFTGHVLDELRTIAAEQRRTSDELMRLTGRFEQHVTEHDRERP